MRGRGRVRAPRLEYMHLVEREVLDVLTERSGVIAPTISHMTRVVWSPISISG